MRALLAGGRRPGARRPAAPAHRQRRAAVSLDLRMLLPQQLRGQTHLARGVSVIAAEIGMRHEGDLGLDGEALHMQRGAAFVAAGKPNPADWTAPTGERAADHCRRKIV